MAEIPLNDNFDAQAWAKEFKKINPEADESIMLGWFANAIMCGYDHASRKQNSKLERAKAALEFYANGDHVTCSCEDEWPDLHHEHDFETEDGTVAREALAELEKD